MTPFEFHTGISYRETSGDWVGQCPFCEREDKFYFTSEGLWNCRSAHCNKEGNLLEFLRQLYDEHETLTKAANTVSTWRSLPTGRISEAGLKYNPWNNTIIIPTFKNGKVANLYKVEEYWKVNENTGEKTLGQNILCTPNMQQTIMNWPDEPRDIVWVVEGHWDYIAAHTIIGNDPNITIIAVPGAGIWKKQWTDLLAARTVLFCYDNDKAGKTGMDVIIHKHIANHPQKPKVIGYVDWTGKPDGYDLNDLYKEHGRSSRTYIDEHIEEYKTGDTVVVTSTAVEEVKPNLDVDSYDKLINIFRDVYHVTSDMEYGLILAMASLYSLKMEGEQLWFRIIGPPSCGKTTIAKAISASDRTVLRSTFTGLFSGWKDETGVDASLVNTIAGKALIVKDADPLLQQTNIGQILGDLRDFYDKDSSTQYMNKVQNDYRNIRSIFLLFGTRALRKLDDTSLGERFLNYEMKIGRKDEELILDKIEERTIALGGRTGNLPPETPVLEACKGFIDHHLLDKSMQTEVPMEVRRKIRRLAKLATQLRTKVDRDTFGKGDVTYTPVAEIPGRLVAQLLKLYQCIPVVLGVHDERADLIVHRVVRDIIDPTSRRFKICEILLEGYYEASTLLESTGFPATTLQREIKDLELLKLLDFKKERSQVTNKTRLFITLTDEVKEAFGVLNKHA